MLPRLQLYGLIALAFVAGAIGVYTGGIMAGIDRTKRKINERRLSNLKEAKEVSDDVEILDDDHLAERARNWVREDSER